MNLKLFFSLPYIIDYETMDSHILNVMIKFDKRFIYEDNFIKVKVRVVNYYESFSHIFMTYKYKTIKNSEINHVCFIAEQEFFDDKILIKKISTIKTF